jgi:hypothetical protein
MKRYACHALAALLVAGLLPLAAAGPAGAAPLAPTLSAPADGLTVTSNPVLEWAAPPPPATGTARFRVQIDDDPGFGSLAANVLTYNSRYAHNVDLPQTTLYWRVAGLDAGGSQGPFSDVRSFTKEAPSGPTLTSPADGATVEFPADPPVLSWEPFSGAKRYLVEIDSEPDFIPPLTLSATSTTNTSYALTAPPTMGQTFYWRVRALSQADLPSQNSEVRSYSYAWPSVPVLQQPPNVNDPAQAIEQVVFDWTPTAGAFTYDLQVSANDQFTGSLTLNVTGVHGTRYTPATNLLAGPYYWRVRARNTAGGVGAWSATSTFYRAWPAPDVGPYHRATLLTPANGDLTVSVPTFSWTPVRLASSYELEMGTDVNFSEGTFSRCTTQQTTFTPISSCNPAPGTVYYWRVRPKDGEINGLYSATSQFQYFPSVPTLASPAHGSLGLTGPVELVWNSVPNIGRYRVSIVDPDGDVVESDDTFQTSYVPQTLDPSDGPFRWYVRTLDSAGRVGLLPNAASWRSFNFTAPTPTSPTPDAITPDDAHGVHVPRLTWEPVAGATTYRIYTATPGSPVANLFRTGLRVNSYVEPDDAVNRLSVGTYDWYVEAYDDDGALISTGAEGTFTLDTLPSTVLTGPAHCPANTNCAAVNVTPTFTWTWDPAATKYIVYLATDPNFTNITETFDNVHFPTFRPVAGLPDAQAGQATYWYARPCYGSRCGVQPSTFAGANPPVRAFRKRSEPVKLLTPANDATVADQITFTWEDYLVTNRSATPANDLEARSYRLQISTSADMQSIIHTSGTLDQTTYTVSNATLPNGPLYWRVQAFDGQNNALSYSSESPDSLVPRLVNKTAPQVTMLEPGVDETVSGVPLFTWAPQDYAVRYELEVYKNVGQPLSTANRVLNVSTPMTGWIPTSALPSGVYGWRVRRLDADNRPGPWTSDDNLGLRQFTLAGAQVTLQTPADGHGFTDDDQGFTWSPAAGAAQYRFQTSTSASFTTTVEQVSTVLTTWHSTPHYANGTYFWRVQTIDGGGNVTATSAVRTFVHGPPQPASAYYHSLTPGRILDSRAAFQVGPYGTPWGPGTVREVEVAGFSGVPADAVAVNLNVTVTGTTASSFLQIAPAQPGAETFEASSINWSAGASLANSVTVRVGDGQEVAIRNQSGSTHVIIDVVGYYDDDGSGGSFTSLTPKRLLDSRASASSVDDEWDTKWGAGVSRAVTVAGVAGSGVPADADAVVLNVTATNPSAGSYLTVWPNGEPRPTASSVNFAAGKTVPNAVTAKVGTAGRVQIYNDKGTVDVIVDVVGYFEQGEGDAFHPLADPVRIQDSRSGGFQVGPYSTPWGAGTSRTVLVEAEVPAAIPASATGVLLNTTVTGTTAGSFLTIYPNGDPKPNASSLNWASGQTVANAVTAKLGTDGRIRVDNQSGSTHVLMDVAGYYGP